MPADWNSFLGALSSRGVFFSDVADATDRKSVITSIGITDPLDIAIIETHWSKQLNSSLAQKQNVNQQQQQNHQTKYNNMYNNININNNHWHRMDPSRLRDEPEEVQDTIIAEELSYALRGISGFLIQFSSPAATSNNNNNNQNHHQQRKQQENRSTLKNIITISPVIPTSTSQMIQKALQNATALFTLETICRHEYSGASLIRGAVGEAVREVCAAYVRCIGDLFSSSASSNNNNNNNNNINNNLFSLSRLCTEVDGIGYPVRRLAALFQSLADPNGVSKGLPRAPDDGTGGLTGPWLLNALHMHYNRCIGNPDDEKIVGLLLRRAARPYLRVLFEWMHRGDLKCDPYREFFVWDTDQNQQQQQKQLQQKRLTRQNRRRVRNNNQNHHHHDNDDNNDEDEFSQESNERDADDDDDDEEENGDYENSCNSDDGHGGRMNHRNNKKNNNAHNSSNMNNNANDNNRDAIDTWEHRFELISRQVPHFLAQNKVYKQIHTAGKYCNMIREYLLTSSSSASSSSSDQSTHQDAAAAAASHNDNKNNNNNSNDPSSLTTTTSFSFLSISEDELFEWGDTGKLERAVHRAHTAASTNVLRMLVSQHRLLDRLKSLRFYFFLAHGDWLVNFLDTANRLLQRPASEVKTYSLNGMLQSSIAKSCSSREDPCHSFTRCSLSDVTLVQAVELTRRRDPSFTNVYRGHFHHQQRNSASLPAGFPHQHLCFELLQLEVVSDWPLSLILNDIFVTKLNFVFRLLLRCKICERALNSAVRQHQLASKSSPVISSSRGEKNNNNHMTNENDAKQQNPFDSGVAVSLRSQLLQFVRQFQFYAAHEVLEPAWQTFMTKVEKAPGINHIGSASSDLCQTILGGLALTSEHGFRILWRILEIILSYSQLMMQYQQMILQSQQQNDYANNNNYDLNPHLTPQAIRQQIQEWLHELYKLLTELADPTQPGSTNLLQLLIWLDFNGFYEKMGVYKVRHAAAATATTTSTNHVSNINNNNNVESTMTSGRPSFQQQQQQSTK